MSESDFMKRLQKALDIPQLRWVIGKILDANSEELSGTASINFFNGSPTRFERKESEDFKSQKGR